MIFSEVKLIGRDRESRRLATRLRASPYAQHQALWSLFDRPPGSDRPFLFRDSRSVDLPTFWLLSDDAPRESSNWRVRSKRFAPRFEQGDRLQFEIRINPSISRRVPGERGTRVDLVGELLKALPPESRPQDRARLVAERLPQWLAERGPRSGFRIAVDEDRVPRCIAGHYARWRFEGRAGRPLTLGVAELSGVLEVETPELFERCVQAGLGHGKAFGLGMWMLRRLRE